MTTTGPDAGGRFARLRGRLTPRTADAVQDDDLRTGALKSGATPIADCVGGEQVVVCGTIRSLTLRPRAGVPALEAELYDGTGQITLVWLGRRQIRGVDTGRGLVVHGRATPGRDMLVIYNPRYELRPTSAE